MLQPTDGISSSARDPVSPERSVFELNRVEWRRVLVLMIAGLALRIALIIALRTYDVPSKDDHRHFAFEYGQIARGLALGHGYASPYLPGEARPTIAGVPFLPFYLSILFRIFGVFSSGAAQALLVTNSLALVLATVPLFAMGKYLFGASVAWLAAMLFCFMPSALWYSVNSTWDTALSCLAITAVPCLFLWLAERPTLARGILVGLCVGATAHVNAGTLTVSVALGAWLLLRSRGRRRVVLCSVAAAGLAGTLAILPWSVRSSLVAGRLVFLRGGGEVPLYSGNYPGATGVLDDSTPDPAGNRAELELYTHMGEQPYFDYCRQRAIRFIRGHPMEYVRLVARRAMIFWLGDPWRKQDWRGSLRLGVSLLPLKQLYYVLPALLAAVGLVVALRRGYDVWPLVIQVAVYSLPYVLVYCTMPRYRFPIEGTLVLLASVALCAGWDLLRRRGASAAA